MHTLVLKISHLTRSWYFNIINLANMKLSKDRKKVVNCRPGGDSNPQRANTGSDRNFQGVDHPVMQRNCRQTGWGMRQLSACLLAAAKWGRVWCRATGAEHRSSLHRRYIDPLVVQRPSTMINRRYSAIPYLTPMILQLKSFTDLVYFFKQPSSSSDTQNIGSNTCFCWSLRIGARLSAQETTASRLSNQCNSKTRRPTKERETL